MKKLAQTTIITSAIAVTLFACKPGSHVIMTADENGNRTSIEYYGKIAFTEDNKGIKSMSKNSEIEFKQRGVKITAKRELEGIVYRVNNGEKVDSLNNEQKQMIAAIIQKVHKE